MATGFAYGDTVREGQLDSFARWAREVRYVRRLGSAALELAWVAAGRLHAHVEADLNEWDWAAGALLVSEAGGTVSHVDVPTTTGPRSTILAAGPRTHDGLVALLTDPVS